MQKSLQKIHFATGVGDLKVPTVDPELLVNYDLINTQISPHNNIAYFYDITPTIGNLDSAAAVYCMTTTCDYMQAAIAFTCMERKSFTLYYPIRK